MSQTASFPSLEIGRQIVGIDQEHLDGFCERFGDVTSMGSDSARELLTPVEELRGILIGEDEVSNLYTYLKREPTEAELEELGDFILEALPLSAQNLITRIRTLPRRLHRMPTVGPDAQAITVANFPRVLDERVVARTALCDFFGIPSSSPDLTWHRYDPGLLRSPTGMWIYDRTMLGGVLAKSADSAQSSVLRRMGIVLRLEDNILPRRVKMEAAASYRTTLQAAA